MPECEAARRNKQALYEIELAWGNGIVDLGKLQRILKGSEVDAEMPPERGADPDLPSSRTCRA